VLPTQYEAATRRLRRLIRSARPDAILCLGVAARRDYISMERVALNLDDDEHPDNAGEVRQGRRIARGGPDVYWSTLPLEALHRALKRRRVPVKRSNHAGTYLCNHVFYVARQETARARRRIPCGFVHLPSLRAGRGRRGMTLTRMMEAVECCLAALGRQLPQRKRRTAGPSSPIKNMRSSG
jgi:pyroglutamyl-peptidase